MKNTARNFFLVLSIAYICFSSCKKQKVVSSLRFHYPVANAGPDTTILFPANTVILDGTGSQDPDNNITAFRWTRILGPASAQIVSPLNVRTMVTDLEPGKYLFELEVTDNTNLIGRDTINVSVVTMPSPPSGSRLIKATILEWGTNSALSGAALFVCTSPKAPFSCAGNYFRVVSDGNGVCEFYADTFRYGWVEFPQSWQNIFDPCFVSYFKNDSLLHQNFFTADSFVVKIVPKSTFSIRIRDTSGRASGYFSLVGDVDFNCVISERVIVIELSPGIDTTIGFSNMYGNSNYSVRVGKNYESDCHCFEAEFYRQVNYVGKRNGIIWNISF